MNRISHRIRKFDVGNNVGSELRMHSHFAHLVGSERAFLAQDVFRNRELSNIVKQSHHRNRFDFLIG